MKYLIDKHIMDKIDTEEKAYWLGFFYADAYNNERRARIVIELQERDRAHLVKCANFFGHPREPFKQIKNGGKYIAYRLELNSRHLSNTLKQHGCHQTKSFNITFPEFLSKDLIHHFVRGYFDGDGCIYVNTSCDQLGIEIVSTREMVDELHNILKTIEVNSYINTRKRYTNNTWRIESGGSKQILRFCEWLYKDATIFLDRKYNIYTEYKLTHTPRVIL